jgi:hypothetical protein
MVEGIRRRPVARFEDPMLTVRGAAYPISYTERVADR